MYLSRSVCLSLGRITKIFGKNRLKQLWMNFNEVLYRGYAVVSYMK